MYPIMLDLRQRPCLVVGAGPVAHRKLCQLLAEGARVTVVAPSTIEPITQLADAGEITLHRRPFADGDVDGCQLVLVATGNRLVDEAVVRAAHARGILVNVADVPDLCDFHLPARIRRGDLQLTIASGGGAPFAVRRLRQLLERKVGPTWGTWLGVAKRFRRLVQAKAPSPALADACFDRFVAKTVDAASLAVRVPSEAELAAWAEPSAEPPMGSVSLVGAGPGHPGLLTVLGMARIRAADTVVYDRLAIPAIPLDLPDDVELIGVGKEPGHHPVPQDEINGLLVRLARAGKRVVRLKGGDPFVFARGGEELEVLRREGIPCEVVPGITAGIAVPASAGIPVTFRGEAVRLTFVTAHEGGAPQSRWDLLAKDDHATLVGYMGVSTLAEVTAGLMAAGMSASTPAAVIEQGTLPRQRAVRAPLQDIASVASQAGLKPPAVFVIGKVAARADSSTLVAAGPLQGLRLGAFSHSPLTDTLAQAGAELLFCPLPLTAAARLVVRSSPLAGWVLQSDDDLAALDQAKGAHLGFSDDTLFVAPPLLASARARGWQRVVELGSSAGDDPARTVERAAAIARR